MSKPINVYSIPELRQTLDEALAPTFKRLDVEEIHGLTDCKLAIGYSIALVAAGSFLIDKKLDHNDTLLYQKILFGAYLVLSLMFWYVTKYVQKNTVFEGKTKSNDIITVKTKLENNVPIYKMTLSVNDTEVKTELPVNEVFNKAGYLQSNLFYEWLGEQFNILTTKKEQ